MTQTILVGDCRDMLATLPDQSVQCCVTSPPYMGLRDYGTAGQIGLEATLAEYIATMVDVFREVRRVLRDDGTLWLNIGDSYNAQPGQRKTTDAAGPKQLTNGASTGAPSRYDAGLKPKDLMMVPARLAIALQDDGWYLRSDIIWHKPNPMPESVRDRPTSAHEHIFLLTKSSRYYWDAAAVAEQGVDPDRQRLDRIAGANGHTVRHSEGGMIGSSQTRNTRNVWTIAPQPFSEAHFATFPPEIPRRCILAGSKEGDTILDPFLGAGTTLLVADRLGREGIGIELNPEYADMARQRIGGDAPLFSGTAYDRPMKKQTRKQDALGKNTYTGFNARYAAGKAKTMAWPHFPEDQLELPGMPARTQEREDQTRGGRVTEKDVIDRRTLCPRCGELRTAGLPCPHCAGEHHVVPE